MRVRHGQRPLVIRLPGNGMLKAPLMLGLILLIATGCSGRTVIEGANTIRGANADAIIDQMYRCAHDALDPNNRGSGCHRSK